MTVITQNTNVTYVGTGSVGPFPFNFPISTPAALDVIQNGTILAITSYTISPVNNNYDNGGLVTLNAIVPVGQSLVLQRQTPLTQTSVYTDNIPQPMQQFEDSLDKLTEIDQELAAAIALIAQYVSVPVAASTSNGTITGSGSTWTLPSLPNAGSLILNFNGQVLTPGVGYNISGEVITLLLWPVGTGDYLNANYTIPVSLLLFL